MPLTTQQIDELKALASQLSKEGLAAQIIIGPVLVLDVGQPIPIPTPSTTVTKVATTTANARFVTGQNDKGKPVMSIYPSDKSAAKDRVQYVKGAQIVVATPVVVGDGAEKFWLIIGSKEKYGVELYVRDVDVKNL